MQNSPENNENWQQGDSLQPSGLNPEEETKIKEAEVIENIASNRPLHSEEVKETVYVNDGASVDQREKSEEHLNQQHHGEGSFEEKQNEHKHDEKDHKSQVHGEGVGEPPDHHGHHDHHEHDGTEAQKQENEIIKTALDNTKENSHEEGHRHQENVITEVEHKEEAKGEDSVIKAVIVNETNESTIIFEKISPFTKGEDRSDNNLMASTGSYVQVLDRDEVIEKGETSVVIDERKVGDFKEVEKEVVFIRNQVEGEKIVTQVLSVSHVGKDDLEKKQEKEKEREKEREKEKEHRGLHESYDYVPEPEIKHDKGLQEKGSTEGHHGTSEVLNEFKPSQEKVIVEKQYVLVQEEVKDGNVVTAVTTIVTQKPAEEKAGEGRATGKEERVDGKPHEEQMKGSVPSHIINIEEPSKVRIPEWVVADSEEKKDRSEVARVGEEDTKSKEETKVKKEPVVQEIQTKKERSSKHGGNKKSEDEPKKKKVSWNFVIAGGISTAMAGFILSKLMFKLPMQKSLLASILVGAISGVLLKR